MSTTPSPPSKLLWPALALVLLLTALVFARPVLHGGFVYDDLELVVRDPGVRADFSLAKAFSQPFWDAADPLSRERVPYYRPLVSLAFHAGYLLSGTAPWGYHLVNLLLHLVCTAAVFALLRELLAGSLAGAFCGALLFGLHSVHTESVAWVSGVSDLSAMAFGLWAWACVLVAARRRRRWPLWLAGALLAAALFAKESAVLIAPILVLSALLPQVAALYRRRPWTSLSTVLAPLLAWYLVRVAVFHTWSAALGRQIVDLGSGLESARSALLPLEFLGHYVALLFAPGARAEFHVFRPGAPLSDPTLVLHIAIGLITLLVALTLVLSRGLGLARRPIALAPWIVIAGLLPALVSPGSLGQFPVSERYLYLPSVGLALALGVLAAHLSRRPGAARYAWLALLVPILALGWISMRYSHVYDDEETFFSDALERAPQCAVAHLGLGRVYLRQAEQISEVDPQAALRLIERALERFRSVSSVYTDDNIYFVAFRERIGAGLAQFGAYLLGASLAPTAKDREEGFRDADRARKIILDDMKAFRARLVEVDPGKAALVDEALKAPEFLVNRAWLAHGLGHFQEAITLCRQALARDSNLFDAHFALATIYRDNAAAAEDPTEVDGLLTHSIESCRRALHIVPRHLRANLLLSRALVDRGVVRIESQRARNPEQAQAIRRDFDEADRILSEARRLYPEHAPLYREQAFMAIQRKRWQEAADLLYQAVQLSGWKVEYVEDLARYCVKRKDPETALKFLFSLREKRPGSIAARQLLIRFLLLLEQGEMKRSKKEIAELRELDPAGWESYFFEAQRFYRLVDNQKAYEAYKKALEHVRPDELGPNERKLLDEAAKFFLAYARQIAASIKSDKLSPEERGRNIQVAARIYGEGVVLLQKRQRMVAWWEYGELLGKAQRFPEAIKALETALKVEVDEERRKHIQETLRIFKERAGN